MTEPRKLTKHQEGVNSIIDKASLENEGNGLYNGKPKFSGKKKIDYRSIPPINTPTGKNAISKAAEYAGCSSLQCNSNQNDGTVIFHHYNGHNSHLFGKGTGEKVEKWWGMYFCNNCHDFAHRHQNKKDMDFAFWQIGCIFRSLSWLISEKIIRIEGDEEE